MMLSMSDIALGKINHDKTSEQDEEEIGNFDFIYGTQDDLNESFEKTEMIMEEAFSHLGTRYRSGAKGPNAFDCSGFTSYVYKQQADIFIGASSRDQYARNTPISRDELQSGDLVFFTSPRSGRNVGHVGVCEFFDSVQRLQIYESATACMKGLYSGFVDGSKIKPEEYNWLKEFDK